MEYHKCLDDVDVFHTWMYRPIILDEYDVMPELCDNQVCLHEAKWLKVCYRQSRHNEFTILKVPFFSCDLHREECTDLCRNVTVMPIK